MNPQIQNPKAETPHLSNLGHIFHVHSPRMDDSGICYSSIEDSFSSRFPHLNISYYSRVTQNGASGF